MKTQKTILTLAIGLFLLVSVSAMYGGECEQVDLSELESLDIVYSVVGNQSNLEGLSIVLNGTIASICPAVNYKPDNFTLIFFSNQTTEVVKEVIVHHGGGTSIKYVDRNITEYVETLRYLDCEYRETINETDEQNIPEVNKLNFFQRLWNWIKNILGRKTR